MEYKYHKNLRKESLRDNMTNTELVLNMLAEVSTTAISRNENPKGLNESKSVAKRGGDVAGNARKDLEYEPQFTYLKYLEDYKEEQRLKRFDELWIKK